MRYVMITEAPDYIVESCASMAAAELGLFSDARGDRIYIVSPSGKKLIRMRRKKGRYVLEDYASVFLGALTNVFMLIIFVLGPILGRLDIKLQLGAYIVAVFFAIQLLMNYLRSKKNRLEEFKIALLRHLIEYGYPTSIVRGK